MHFTIFAASMKSNTSTKKSLSSTRNLMQLRKDFTSVAHKGTPLDPKLLTSTHWSKDDLGEVLVKIKQVMSSGLVN